MAKYDNIDVNGNKVEPSNTPTYDSIMKQKAKDTKKALHKQKKEDDAEKADAEMQKEIDAEAEAQKEVEKKALENNGSSVETRDKNKAIQEGDKTVTAVEDAKVAAKEPVENAEAVEQIASETKVEPEAEEEIPENVKAELESSDEGQQANAAVESNNPADLQNITDPEGNPVLKGTYDADGIYKVHTYSLDEAAKLQNKGWAGVATIISLAISSLGAMAGIPIMPINFFKVTGIDDYANKLNENEKNYAEIMNGGKKEANEILRTEDAKTRAYESNAQAAIDKPELYKSDVQNKVAGSAAALAGGNTQLQTQESAQEFQAAQNDFDRQFQKEMAQINNDSAMALLKQQGINAQDLLKLQADENAMADLKKITAMKNAGLSDQEAAQWIRSLGGMTALQAYLGPLINGAGQAAGILTGLFAGGTSDKNVKKFAYDGKAANSKMFSSKRKFW